MVMSNKISYNIVHLSRLFNDLGDKSMHSLLRETGYAKIRDQITVDTIRSSLTEHPDFITDWMQYSSNKRTREGWYFIESTHGGFIVGYLSSGKDKQAEKIPYDNALDACAMFVKQEIDSIL